MRSQVESRQPAAGVRVETPAAGALRLSLSGDWLLESARPHVAEVLAHLEADPPPARLEYRSDDLGAWDSALIHYLVGIERRARRLEIAVDDAGLPEGAARLVRMALAVPPSDTGAEAGGRGPLTLLGERARAMAAEAWSSVTFLGELVRSLGRLLAGRATYRRSELWVTVQEVSAEALGIVALISFLVGVILAFIGASELQKLGAGIYSANLVGLGMLRELGPLMVGIIMTGRTGAAFAARIGTMKVNEEIDALQTLGIDPIDHLVLPRVLALTVTMPLLTLYGDLFGLLGGTVVSVVFLDLTPLRFLTQLRAAVGLGDLIVGLVMAAVFGVLVALAGCQRGIQCGSSAQSVGAATTSAVVTGIVAIICACAVLNMVYAVLGV